MKKFVTLSILFFSCSLGIMAQNIGIGTSSPDNSAALDIDVTDKGLLIPRMASAQRTMIVNPAQGLLVYDTTTNTFWYFNTNWIEIQNSAISVFENNAGLVRNTGASSDDFIFGHNALPQNGTNVSERFWMFDESKAAFRVGRLLNSNGWSTDSLGINSVAMGLNVKAKGQNSLAVGSYCEATGDKSIALGNSAIAEGLHAVSIGNFTNALADGSISMGSNSKALGINSVSIGVSTKAEGNESFAIGNNTVAYGLNAMSMGKQTEANGDYSKASGHSTKANGAYSSSNGLGTRSSAYASFSIGKHNLGAGDGSNWISTDPVFEIGIGASSLTRENALTVLKNGTIAFNKYTFPLNDGNINEVLTTDGSGALSWSGLLDNSNTNELINTVSLSGNTLTITDPGNSFVRDLSTLVPHSISDDDSDTHIQFNNSNDKIIFTTNGANIAKMESDSIFLAGNLKIGSTTQASLHIADNFYLSANNNNFIIRNAANSSDDLVINNQGQLGIGTNNPSETLDVYAKNDFDGIRIRGGLNNDQVQLKLENNTSQGKEYLLRSTGNNASQGGGKFIIRDATAGSSRMTIDSTGKIGIGTLSPTEKLQVNGDIKAEGLAGSTNAQVWVDNTGKLIRADNNLEQSVHIDFLDFIGTSLDEIQYHMIEGVFVWDGDGSILGSMSQIPDGATITKVKVTYFDNDSSSGHHMNFSIQSYDGIGNPVLVHSLGSSTSGNVRRISTYNSVNYTLDRSNYNYGFSISSQHWSTAVKLYSVEIFYTL